jgi:hypothetical protein
MGGGAAGSQIVAWEPGSFALHQLSLEPQRWRSGAGVGSKLRVESSVDLGLHGVWPWRDQVLLTEKIF